MKRTAAILLMGMLFFNWYGYQLLSSYWLQRADRRLEAALDRHEYADSSLISIRIPVRNLSCYNTSSDFEKVKGRVTIGNLTYRYSLRRILNDSLEFLCIPDLAALQFRSATNEYFERVNDLVQQHPSGQLPHSGSSHQKGFQKDYAPDSLSYFLYGPVEYIVGERFGFISTVLPLRDIPTTEQPPDPAI